MSEMKDFKENASSCMHIINSEFSKDNLSMVKAQLQALLAGADFIKDKEIVSICKKALAKINSENIQELKQLLAKNLSIESTQSTPPKNDKCQEFINQAMQGAELITDQEFEALLDKLENIQVEVKKKTVQQPTLQLSSIIDKLSILINSLAKELKKEVAFTFSGKNCEINQENLQILSEILPHIVRNAIVHGIEVPDLREQAGKSKLGVIEISFAIENNQLITIVKDNGVGLNLEEIKSSIIDKKLLSKQELEKLSASAINNYIFNPGISTQKSADKNSGRGVGLDVAKTSVVKRKGEIKVDTFNYQGVKFTIILDN